MVLKYIIEENNILVKEYLELKGLSRNIKKKARVEDAIYINGVKGKNYFLLNKGDLLELRFNERMNEEILINKNLKLDILYEDDYILIINKQRNISSQPSMKHPEDNIISALKYYFINNNINSNFHLVNRLDYSTSGLMIIAKDGITHFEFSKINITKQYLCEITGHINPTKGVIKLPIARYKAPSIKRYVSTDGKESITYYEVIKTNENTDIVKVKLCTGRTHQIRVHFSHLSHPLIGDSLYGNDDYEFLKLHCFKLNFIHPYTKKEIEIIKYPDWIEEELCLE